MARLIRLDRTGHTTLAEWTAEDAAAREAAVEAFRRELDEGMLASVPRADGERRGGPGAAAGRRAGGAAPSDRRRLSGARARWRPSPAAAVPARAAAWPRGGRPLVAPRGERADAAPRRAAVDGVDGVDRDRLHGPGRRAARARRR